MYFMLQNYIQFVKNKKELFFIYFNRVISEYSCSHMAIVFFATFSFVNRVAAHAHSELQ